MDAKILMQDLAAGVAQRSGLLKKDSDTFVRLFFETIEESLSEEKNVKVKGLGTFKVVEVSGRDSVNVNTGERIHIKGHSKINFTPDTGLRDFVNRPFADFETIVLNDGVDIAKMEYTGEAATEEEATPVVEEPVVPVVEEVVPAVEEPTPVVEEPVVHVVEEVVPAVEEPAPVVEEPVVPAVEEVAPVVEEPEVPVVEEVAPVVEEPAPVVEESKSAEVQKIAEQPVVEGETVTPEEPERGSVMSKMFKYVACVAFIAIMSALGYGFATGKLSLGGNDIIDSETRQVVSGETEKPVNPVEEVKAATAVVEPQAEPFDSATVNDRFKWGAYEICGIQCKHVVAEGEDIETIAKQYLKSKSNKVYIAAMNDINTYKPVVEVGQELIIPEIRLKSSKK